MAYSLSPDQTTLTNGMDLHQWDIVSALSLPTVNEQLRRNFSALPGTFEFLDVEPAGGRLQLKGTFGSWQLVSGGAGNLVHLALGIAQGTYVRSDSRGDTIYDLAGVVVKVELMLSFLRSAAAVPGQELRFDFQTDHGQVPRDPAIFCKDVTLPPGSRITLAHKLLVGQALTQCLFAHQASVTYVFAALSTGGAAGLPAPTRYAFLNAAPEGTSQAYFAILSAVFPEHGQGQAAVDPALFEPAAPVVLALSKEYLLRYVVLPQLPAVFRHGTGSGHFSYDSGTITNTEPFDLDSVQSGALWYQPVVEQLRLTVDGAFLEVRVSGSCYISPGIYARFTCTSRNPVVVEDQGIRFEADPHPAIEHHLDVATWVIVGAVILALVAAVVEIVVVAVVAGVSAGVTQALNGTENAFTMQALRPAFLDWKDFRLQHVTSGGLNDNLFLRGN